MVLLGKVASPAAQSKHLESVRWLKLLALKSLITVPPPQSPSTGTASSAPPALASLTVKSHGALNLTARAAPGVPPTGSDTARASSIPHGEQRPHCQGAPTVCFIYTTCCQARTPTHSPKITSFSSAHRKAQHTRSSQGNSGQYPVTCASRQLAAFFRHLLENAETDHF
ncbi:hypothetical protein MHYP_G00331160 [Metynnis hypsauchen]